MKKPPAPVYWFDAWVEKVSIQLAENISEQQPKGAKLSKLRLIFSEGSVWPDLYEVNGFQKRRRVPAKRVKNI